jgi:ribosomal protein L7/L12
VSGEIDDLARFRITQLETKLSALYAHLGLEEPETPTGLGPDVVEAIRGGNTIEAIKRYRAATGADLKSAKDAVDAYMAGG